MVREVANQSGSSGVRPRLRDRPATNIGHASTFTTVGPSTTPTRISPNTAGW